MKKWLINFLLLSIAIGVGVGLFLMKQRVVEYEKKLSALTNTILENKREIHTLKADWAVLTEPSRLRHLLSESDLKQIGAAQIITPDAVELSPVPVPTIKPFEEENNSDDPTKMEQTHEAF